MSRITDSLKALKAERRSKARELRQIDRLLSHFETLTNDAPKRRRKAVAKPKPKNTATPRKPRKSSVTGLGMASRTASLVSAAQD